MLLLLVVVVLVPGCVLGQGRFLDDILRWRTDSAVLSQEDIRWGINSVITCKCVWGHKSTNSAKSKTLFMAIITLHNTSIALQA